MHGSSLNSYTSQLCSCFNNSYIAVFSAQTYSIVTDWLKIPAHYEYMQYFSVSNLFLGSFLAPTVLRPHRSGSCGRRSRHAHSLLHTACLHPRHHCSVGRMLATAAYQSDLRLMTEAVAAVETLYTTTNSLQDNPHH